MVEDLATTKPSRKGKKEIEVHADHGEGDGKQVCSRVSVGVPSSVVSVTLKTICTRTA